MEITRVEAINLDPDVESVSMRMGSTEQRVAVRPVVVRVHTDEGITGIGETLTYDPDGREAEFVVRGVRSLADGLVGTDPLAVTRRWEDLYDEVKRSRAFKPLSAIDEALWDVVGKRAGEPLYQLLGGQTGPVAAYATFPFRKPTDELIEDGRWLAEKGFDSMKITVGRDVESDRQRVRTVHEHLPDGFGLSIDANTSFDFSDALALAETADELELEWFEEPIAHTDYEGQAELNRRTSVPIAAYQSHAPHYPALEHLERNALEIYQPSLYLCGGVTSAARVATLTEAYNKRFVPHAFGPAINYAASLHVAAASPACDLIEFAVYDDELDDPGRYVASPYVENQDDLYVDDDGVIEPPEEPGIGVRLDEDAVEEFRVD